MQPSNGCKLQAPSCSAAAIGPCGRIFLNRGIKFADVQRNTIDHRMAEMGQTRPRRPPPWRAYAPPVLSSKRTHAGRPDQAALGQIRTYSPQRDVATYSRRATNVPFG